MKRILHGRQNVWNRQLLQLLSLAYKLLREGVMAWLDEPHAAQGPKYWGFELPIHTESRRLWVSETHDTWNSAVFVGVCSAWTFTAKCQTWQDLGDQSSSICDHMKAVVKCVLKLNDYNNMYFVAVCSRWRRFFVVDFSLEQELRLVSLSKASRAWTAVAGRSGNSEDS